MAEQVEKGHRTALELALRPSPRSRPSALRTQEQRDLFADEVQNLPEVAAPVAADGTHRGRRPGVRDKPH